MKIFITGGTGFVGRSITKKLLDRGDEVTVLTRSLKNSPQIRPSLTLLEGDPTREGPWQEKVSDHEVIINLAGSSIFRRWTSKSKKLILESRVLTTANLVQAFKGSKGKDTLFLSNSAVGYYGFTGDEFLDEDSPPGNDFLADVTRKWEAAARKAEDYGVRVVMCRLGIVLGRDGGALSQMLPLFRKGLGSALGSGNQWFSWVHEDDLADIYLFLMEQKNIRGPVNFTSPHPVRNKDLTQALAEALGRRVLFPPVPGFVIRMAKGEFGSVVLKGQRVIPAKLNGLDYKFRYPDIRSALQDLI